MLSGYLGKFSNLGGSYEPNSNGKLQCTVQYIEQSVEK